MDILKYFKKPHVQLDRSTGELITEVAEIKDVNALPASYVPPVEALALTQVSTALFRSGLFSSVGNEAGAFAVCLLGRELGIGAMTALQNIAIIKGKFSCSAQLQQARAVRRGLTFDILRLDNEGCELRLHKNGKSATFSFNKEDAQRAGLIRADSGYVKYPSDMYFCRAMTKGLRKIDPECVLGLYTIEEVSEGQYSNVEDIPAAEFTEIPPTSQNGQPGGHAASEKQMNYVRLLVDKRVMSDSVSISAENFLSKSELQTPQNASQLIERLRGCPEK